MSGVTESTVEEAALAWLENLGWNVAHGPDIAPDTPGAERADYGQVVLVQRVRDALARFNPDLPAEALDDAFRRLVHSGRADAGGPQPRLSPYDHGRRHGGVPGR